jgi:WD40 repeat protein/tetratricopeptide (TPR) repeat protein
MTSRFTCPLGHEWEVAVDTTDPATAHTLCPVCRSANTLPVPPATEAAPPTAAVPPRGVKEGETLFDQVRPPAAGPQATGVPGYEIESELGRGGMGVVYRARQVKANRVVALKMILGAGEGAAEMARFRTEAEASARLQHPNIVQVFEVGDHGGRPFFSLEFCGGGSLDRKLKGTPLPPAEAARLTETLARAMHAAHGQQVLHRDLKPANVFLAADGTPKIADFGLAKKLDDVSQTKAGAVVGTPSYMPPEQALGQTDNLGPAVDIYALGAILYELLSGRPPFRAATTLATLKQVISDDPVPPRRLQPQTPRDLETICLKCLHKDPKRRYATAEELAADLRRFLNGEPISARPISRAERFVKWVKRHPGVAGMVALVCLVTLVGLGLVTWKWREAVDQRAAAVAQQLRAEEAGRDAETARKAAEVQRRQAEAAEEKEKSARKDAVALAADKHERLVNFQVAEGVRLEDDGDLLGALPWFAAALTQDHDDPEHARLHRLRLATATRQCPPLLQTLFPERAVLHAEFSPDDRFVLTTALGWARVWDAATGAPVTPAMTHGAPLNRACFSPDGRHVLTAFAKDDGTSVVRLWDAASGKPVTPPSAFAGSVNYVEFNPKGDRLVTASDTSKRGQPGGEALVWDAETLRPVTPPLRHGDQVYNACFSPDGRRVLTASADGTARQWDAATGELIGPPLRPEPRGLPLNHAAYSRDGSRVVTCKAKHAQVWNAATGEPIGHPLRHSSLVAQASFNPDGTCVVTASWDETAQVWFLQTGERLSLPMRHRDFVTSAVFSPDGKNVLTVGLDNTARIWNASTGKHTSAPLKHNGKVKHAAFSHDGKRVLTASADETVRIWDVDPARKRTTPTLEAPGYWLQAIGITTDGRRVLCKNARIGPEFPAVFAAQTGATFPANLPWAALALSTRWERPEQELYTTARVWDLTTGKPLTPLLEHAVPVEHGLFSPDGRRALTISLPTGGKVTLRLWDAETGRSLTPPLEHPGFVSEAKFSPDGRLLVTAGGGAPPAKGEARVWDVETGRQVIPPVVCQKPVLAASFSPDGRLLATTATQDLAGALQVRDVATGRRVVDFPRVGSFSNFDGLNASFSLDGGRLAVPSIDGEVQILDLAMARPVGPVLKHDNWVWQAVFSPDGKRVVTASSDRTGRVWDVATGRPVTPPLRHRNEVVDAAFSPDGRLVATAASDGTARVWEAGTGVPVTPPLEHASMRYVNRAAFSPDGKRVFTGAAAVRQIERVFGYGRTARDVWVWDLSVDDQPVREAVLLAEWLAGQRLDATGSCVPLNWPDALDHLDVLIAARPGEWPLVYRRGRAHARQRRWEQAIADYTRAIELGARDGDIYYYRSKARGEQKQWAEAEADASKALELGFDEWQGLAQHGACSMWVGRYDRMLADYDRVIALDPGQGNSYASRGSAHAALGRWDRAEADYAKAHELGTVPSFEYQRAILRLAVNDVPGYRKACAEMVERGGPAPDPDQAGWIAWSCVLVPDAGPDPARLLQLAERAAVVAPRNRDSLLVRGAALYRAGKWQEAAAVLEEARATVGQKPQTPEEVSGRLAPHAFDDTGYELFFLAMAHHRLGHADEARQWLEKGARWIEQGRLPKTEQGADNPRFTWNRRVAHEQLRREAEALLEGAKPERE